MYERFAYMFSVHPMCAVLMEAKREYWIPWNQNCRRLLAATRMPEIERGPLEVLVTTEPSI